MNSIRAISNLNPWSQQRHVKPSYEPVRNDKRNGPKGLAEEDNIPSCSCPTHISPSRRSTRARITLELTIALSFIALWTFLLSCFFARNPHLLWHFSGSKNLVDQFPNVPMDFQSDNRFVNSDPFGSTFWHPVELQSDKMEDNAWNYYGNDWIWLKKGSPYEVPGGRELIPLYPEKDAWMKDYKAYISAYKHEIHCVGIIKHILNAYRDGKNVTAAENEHANAHCLEVLRHSVMCQPDLTLAGPEYDAKGGEHEPFWGGAKHMCRDQSKVHEFLAERNMGFEVVLENGVEVTKAWAWPLHSKGGVL